MLFLAVSHGDGVGPFFAARHTGSFNNAPLARNFNGWSSISQVFGKPCYIAPANRKCVTHKSKSHFVRFDDFRKAGSLP